MKGVASHVQFPDSPCMPLCRQLVAMASGSRRGLCLRRNSRSSHTPKNTMNTQPPSVARVCRGNSTKKLGSRRKPAASGVPPLPQPRLSLLRLALDHSHQPRGVASQQPHIAVGCEDGWNNETRKVCRPPLPPSPNAWMWHLCPSSTTCMPVSAFALIGCASCRWCRR